MKICVFGAASTKIDPSYVAEVEKLGAMLVQRGHELVFGAGGNGLMGASRALRARGVKKRRGPYHRGDPVLFPGGNHRIHF